MQSRVQMNYKKTALYTSLIIIAITGFLGFQLSSIGFDFSMKNFYPLNNPETKFFYQYTNTFEWDNDYILIGLETNSETVFEEKFMQDVDSLSKLLNKHKYVAGLTSPTTMEVYRHVPFLNTVSATPLLHINEPERLIEDSAQVFSRKELIGRLFAANKKSVAIVVKQTPNMEFEECSVLVDELAELVQPFQHFKKVHFAGKCFGQTTFVKLTRTEILMFVILSVLVNIVFLFFTYRSFSGVWMPMVVVGFTVIWTIGLMSFLGLQLDFISNIIPSVILIIGISNVIHLYTKFLGEKERGLDRIPALKAAIREVGTATILTSITTIIGFLSLLFSNVRPLINLGGYASLGLVFAFILTYTLFPALIILQKKEFKAGKNISEATVNKHLISLFEWVMQKKVSILVISAILLVLGIWGTSKLVVNQRILEDLHKNHPQMVASNFFEDVFSGTRQFEMQINLKDTTKTVLDADVLADMEKIENFLGKEYSATAMFSPVGIMKEANRVKHSGQSAYFVLPESESDHKKALKTVTDYLENGYPKVYTEDRKIGRFSSKMPDIGSAIVREHHKNFAAFMAESGLDKKYDCRMTGSAFLLDLNNTNIAKNVFYGLIVCFLIIGIILGLLFKSIRIAVLGLIPNILPLLIVGGIMGFTGVNVKISTSILFIISFGIAVDDTIHFMSSYRFQLTKTGDVRQALLNTYLSTGKAIIATTLILSSGFATLAFSTFKGTFHIGLFTSICLALALLADLFLLPVLIYYLGGKKHHGKAAEKKEEELAMAMDSLDNGI